MKRVIAGRVYSTETAELICELPCSYGRSDFQWHDTNLYRTKNGNYFLSGTGGPSSMWAESAGQNSWSGGSGIRPLDKADAMHYAESAELSPEEMTTAGFEIQDA